jgi:hypothetical protein
MKARFKQITLKELEPMVRDYLAHLPGWQQVQRNTLARTEGPILQCIGFEALSFGPYRPVGYIQVLIVPSAVGGMELPQYLKEIISIRRMEHERRLEKVIEAMRHEFKPDITQPLDSRAVLELYEREATPKSYEAYSLASLNAYFGNKERALYWSARFNELVEELYMPWQEWDKERRAFLDTLEMWIREGTEKQSLEEILQKEKEKWGVN